MSKRKYDIFAQQSERRLVLFVYDSMKTLIIALSIFALLFAFVVRVVGVDGDSMQPTLCDGDRLLLSIVGDTYNRGDIIVVDRYTDEPLIKRVIAVGGDTIAIDSQGRVFINGKKIQEEYIQGETILRDFSGKATVPQGYLFVMGDNRSISKDSRHSEIGLVSTKDVVGRAVFCVWPVESIGRT